MTNKMIKASEKKYSKASIFLFIEIYWFEKADFFIFISLENRLHIIIKFKNIAVGQYKAKLLTYEGMRYIFLYTIFMTIEMR